MIILTPAQADQVRGLTIPGHALVPVLLNNGNFALPDAVVNDPAHAKFSSFLKTLPTVLDSSIAPGTKDINGIITGSDWNRTPALTTLEIYKPSWPPGRTISVNLQTMTATVGS